ncbi:hypothetical protein ABZ154_30360 [Streptomyces sp. NPDC006261]|uniref:hypothetical protein n=1 Tax=Streptomyces sp. NPDC006261 TaxID=3156739 RepID=UPI0033B40966
MNGPLKPISAPSLVAVQASELGELPKRDVHPITIEVFEIRLRQLIESDTARLRRPLSRLQVQDPNGAETPPQDAGCAAFHPM